MPIKIPCETIEEKPAEIQINHSAVVFDIETIPQSEERLAKIMPEFKPDARLKDEEKIKANVEGQKERWLRDAALDWKTAQVVLIGVGDGERYAPIVGTEEQVISSFFQMLETFMRSETFFGGHAVKNFDIQMLVNRARVLRLGLPEGLMTWYNGRPKWHPFLFDTLEVISFGDRQNIEGNGVEAICRTLGVNGKLGDGANFPELWKKNKDGAVSYNRADIMAEIEIAKFCGFKFGK